MKITLTDLGLENNLSTELYNKYCHVLNVFLSSISYEGIESLILCGSFAKEKLTVGSDIDLVIIWNQKLESVIIEWIEIGIICYEKNDFIKDMQTEENSFIRRLSNLVSHGITIYWDWGNIISIWRDIVSASVPKLSQDELKKISNFIKRNKILAKDYLKRHDDLAFYSRMSFSIQQATQNYFKLNKQAIPDWKRTWVGITDKNFHKALLWFFEWKDKQEKYKNFKTSLGILEKLVSRY